MGADGIIPLGLSKAKKCCVAQISCTAILLIEHITETYFLHPLAHILRSHQETWRARHRKSSTSVRDKIRRMPRPPRDNTKTNPHLKEMLLPVFGHICDRKVWHGVLCKPCGKPRHAPTRGASSTVYRRYTRSRTGRAKGYRLHAQQVMKAKTKKECESVISKRRLSLWNPQDKKLWRYQEIASASTSFIR